MEDNLVRHYGWALRYDKDGNVVGGGWLEITEEEAATWPGDVIRTTGEDC